MDSKRKNIAKEPSEVYEPSSKVEENQEKLHPLLVKVLEKSAQQAKNGEVYSTEEVMKRAKERFPFLK